MYKSTMVILKGKLNPKVSKDNVPVTRRLQMEEKKVKKIFQSDKFGHVNVFMSFFSPYKIVQMPVFWKLC